MRILFLSDNFPPEVNAPATRTWEHCREWVGEGAQVTVITCAPNFPRGKVYGGYRNRWRQPEKMDGIEVVRVWSYITANEGVFRRTLDYLSFAFTAFLAGLKEKPDVIVATSPQFFTVFAGRAMSWIKRKPWVFEVRDLWPESISTVGAMREGRLTRILSRIELSMYRSADLVVSVTEAIKEKIVDRGIPPGKVAIVPNGANLELFAPREKNGELSAKLGLEGKFVLAYIGTHGMAHGLEFIVRSLAGVVDGDFHVIFIGDGARKDEVVRLAKEVDLTNATFLDPVPKEEVPEYLSLADAVLVPLLKRETFRTVLPSKIFEAAAMEKPILLGVEGQAQEMVEGYGAGICYEPENGRDFLAKLEVLREKGEGYKGLQEGCRRLAGDYDRKRLAECMHGELVKLCR